MSDQTTNPVPDESVAVEAQRNVYIQGASGIKSDLPISFEDMESMAEKRLSAKAFAYIAGGAGKERTILRNREAFGQWKILPRMLRDVSDRDLSISLFDRPYSTPFLLAPIGVLDLAHKEADLAVARAAAGRKVPMIFSSQASTNMETCSQAMGNAPKWFQLYWSKSDDLVRSFVQRAETCGCEAIVITLDTTLLGWRERDLQQAYLPFMEGRGIAQYVSDPVFQSLLDAPEEEPGGKRKITLSTLKTVYSLMSRYPGSFFANLRSGKPVKAVRKFIDIYSRPSLSWEDIPRIREYTSLPILLKGILHPDDARRAMDLGMDGIIVSNHGGRQVDGSVSSMEMLPKIAEVVGGKIPIMLDSGIRSGADVFKALALGATAVCLGRPYVYALALGGQKGVDEYLRNIIADFELTMGLAGCKSVSEISMVNLMKD
ncbi:MAG: lactate 2-monooxygenase [Bacteroidetes bacterium]|nr:lactate 2-monooxygenase [Bacteroidota bacterium]